MAAEKLRQAKQDAKAKRAAETESAKLEAKAALDLASGAMWLCDWCGCEEHETKANARRKCAALEEEAPAGPIFGGAPWGWPSGPGGCFCQ